MNFKLAKENYVKNLSAWRAGLNRLDELDYKPDWNAGRMKWLYIFDHGSRVLFGGAVVTWSRWFYEQKEEDRAAAFMNRLLNHFDSHHGKESGVALWDTVDCPRWFQLWLVVAGILLICGIVILV